MRPSTSTGMIQHRDMECAALVVTKRAIERDTRMSAGLRVRFWFAYSYACAHFDSLNWHQVGADDLNQWNVDRRIQLDELLLLDTPLTIVKANVRLDDHTQCRLDAAIHAGGGWRCRLSHVGQDCEPVGIEFVDKCDPDKLSIVLQKLHAIIR